MAGLRRASLILLAALGFSLAPPAPQLWGEPDGHSASPSIGGRGGPSLASLGSWAGLAWAAPAADAASTLVVIDAPKGGTTSTQLEVRGWAADPNAPGGTGVDVVEVYLDGERDAGGTRLGQATYGLRRPDVAAHLGSQQFLLSGFALQTTVAAGPHTVYVYAHPSDQPANQGWAPPKQAALMAVAGAPLPGTAGGPGGAITLRQPNATGSITLDLPGVGSNYPPGPADTGGPIYAPPYLGYGFYGGPFPDYLPYYGGGIVVPPWFDFSLGYGWDLYGVGALTLPSYFYPGYYPGYYSVPHFPNYFFDYTLPAWRRFGWASGPVYCPLYTAVVC
jgi:hypothetical protein